MNKFALNLSATNKSIRQERAARIAKIVEAQQTVLVGELQNEVWELENKIEAHLDLSPTHTTSLSFDKVEDGKSWVKEYQRLKLEKSLKQVELEIAVETQKELFTDIKENDVTV